MRANVTYLPVSPEDLDRVIAAWMKREGARIPARSGARLFPDGKGRIIVELHNINGFLAAYSVTPKRVTFLPNAVPMGGE